MKTTDSAENQRFECVEIVELCCHIDDMSAEALAFASEQLYRQGARDVSYAPITMKKSRPGTAMTVLCSPEDEERMVQAVMRETSTIGLRARTCRKYFMKPTVVTMETMYGPVRVKCADGYGLHREKPEYEDVAAIAKEKNLPFQQVWEEILVQIRNRLESVSDHAID